MELLVVIAILGILGGLLLPALTRSKGHAQAIICANNTKNLTLNWMMYSMENSDKLAYNLGSSPQLRAVVPISSPNWVNNVLDWELSPANTNLNFVGQSVLSSSAHDSAAIFHCPSDNVLSSIQKNAGWSGRVRSVSMNAMVGDPGSALYQSGTNYANPGYTQFLKESDFRDPSSIFVFLDEHPDSISDGFFVNKPTSLEWVRLPGSYHNGGGSFSFADGHTEVHRWQCATTIRPNAAGGADLPIFLNGTDLTDFNWVNRHASYASQ
jgi:prepilin-type processing-associated H-X9-DG protein